MPGAAYRLSFLLPPALAFSVAPGRHQPCLHGCVLNVHRDANVTIEGPSRERVFDQARRFLRLITKGMTQRQIDAVLYTPPSDGCRGGRDPWSIIVNAEVAIVPTAMPADLGEPLERAG